MTSIKEEDEFYLQFKPKFQTFHELMQKRLNRVLVVASHYDSFILEEDGRLSDQIYSEWRNLNLTIQVRITSVTSATVALELLRERHYDLVITMRRLGDIDPFSFGREVKKIQDVPVILLLNNAPDLKFLPESREARKGIDRTFLWTGDSHVFLAIIKSLEDKLNVKQDTEKGLVRVIIVVEDSIRYASLFLPLFYSEIMKQTHRLITEGVNDFQNLLQMKGRPKILLADSYEEAIEYYQNYRKFVIGIISDISFPRNGKMDREAGISLIRQIKAESPTLPVVLQSSDRENQKKAEEIGAYFIHKQSRRLLKELRKFMLTYLGFGDFIFRLPDGKVVGRAINIIEFHKAISKVPTRSLVYHGEKDHFSGWLAARGEFLMAEILKPRKVSEFHDAEDLRVYLLKAIEDILVEKTTGVINDFSRENYQPNTVFIRLRPGSLGGKGRGIAFLMFLLNSFQLMAEFPSVAIKIPKTIVIGTDEFDRFMDSNDLYDIALSDISDERIKKRFIEAELSQELVDDLKFLLKKDLKEPLAIRSSSVLEDSQYQPFAGVFATYMVPNNEPDLTARLSEVCTAIKLVYASTFLKSAKSYSETIGQTIEEAKMAIIIQKIVGQNYKGKYYPNFSGTALSLNFYPISYLKPEDKIAFVALGLGKTIVDGGAAYRFSPNHPKAQFLTQEQLLENSQKHFFAVNCKHPFDHYDLHFDLSDASENSHLIKASIYDARKDGTLEKVVDTYDYNDSVLRPGYWEEGTPIITFSNQLKYDSFPLARLISRILSLGEKAMGSPVEIEYAGNFKGKRTRDEFYLLQIRPFTKQEEYLGEELENIDKKDMVVFSKQISGNRVIKDIRDVVYIKPDKFDRTRTLEIIDEIDKINRSIHEQNILGTNPNEQNIQQMDPKGYILIGFGRWGTFDRFLGIPVKWNNISSSKVIIEACLKDFQVQHSQGSHFFQNITTAGIPYFYVKHGSSNGFIDWEYLEEQEIISETKHVRHVRTIKPFLVKVDGKKGEGIIIKPKK
ncbi:MAG: PEP/pyruvate-binding domain-containing protein [Candidatus Hodarchaeales archaeon]|jgi:CheY-like chemotaxis protein